MSRVIVIGGGAAGMMAAIRAAEKGNQVTLLEKNEKLGKKIYITGKGRCNLTNACAIEELFKNVVQNGKFLYSAFYHFSNQQTIEFFKNHGLEVKTERGERVFPKSDHASDVIRTLQNVLSEEGVTVRLHAKAAQILTEEEKEDERYLDTVKQEKSQRTGYLRKVTGVRLADQSILEAEAVILATGGCSYASTGSDGDGYRFAQTLGHTVTQPRPSLVPFETKEKWVKDLQGLSLRNVEVKIQKGRKLLYQEFGEMLFTHYGVSGPLMLSASSVVNDDIQKMPLTLEIDLKPALTLEQLDKRILRDFKENQNRQFKNSLNGLFPAKLIPVMIKLSGIDAEQKVNEIMRKERQEFARLIKHFPLTLQKLRDFNEAVITRGGISTKEVNPSTMESKLISGLYIAGEVLDTDALTGGFNLQIAWSTGYLAGESSGRG